MCNTITKFILITLFILLSACGGGGNDEAGDSNPSVSAKTSLVAIGDVDCTYGGVLDDNEVDKSEKVCNGSPGSDGNNGLDDILVGAYYADNNDIGEKGEKGV